MNDDIREPDQIRQDAARKLRTVQVSEHFQAILGCMLGEDWTTPRLVEMTITPDGHLLGRCDGEPSFKAFLGASQDLLRTFTVSPRSPNSTATKSATLWPRLRRLNDRRDVIPLSVLDLTSIGNYEG